MISSLRRNQKTKRSNRFDLNSIPADKRGRYLEQLRGQGVSLTKPKATGRYQVSAPDQRTVDGVVFDSKWEAQVYTRLRQVLGADRIKLQVPYELQESFVFEGKKIRASHYVADYVIDGVHVCDAKGHLTSEFKEKRKQFIYRYRKGIYLFFKMDEVDSFLKTLESKS